MSVSFEGPHRRAACQHAAQREGDEGDEGVEGEEAAEARIACGRQAVPRRASKHFINCSELPEPPNSDPLQHTISLSH